MLEVLTVLLVFVLVAIAVSVTRAPADDTELPEPGEAPPAPEALVRQHPFVPWIVGGAVAAALVGFLGLYVGIALAAGAVAGVGCAILLHYLATRRLARLEFQLADSIDLMVSTLRAGGGLTDALANATRETRRPLRNVLQELLDRIRLGDRPEVVLADLEVRVSLESFRLFALTLAAHWQGGGSLATTLSNVGRTIRDRVEVARRIRAQAIESKVSVFGVLVVTYGLALLMWNNYPDRFETFATSELGSMFIAGAVLLEGIGLLWIWQLTKIEV